jgi:ADP-ribosyl-[dinitrogen reductase] hydrolase
MNNTIDKLHGGLYGALIGDAVGVPYEFKTTLQIPHPPTMVPPPKFNRSYLGVPPGTWSDDGALTLCLMESLLKADDWLDTDWVHAFGHRMSRWRYEGYMTPDNKKFDIGNQTSEAIRLLEFGLDPLELTYTEYENGNGGLMRALPVVLALWKSEDIDLICAVSDMHHMVSHGHPISLICGQIYVMTAIMLLRGDKFNDAFWAAVDIVEARCDDTEWQGHFATVLAGKDEEPRGTGYVVDTLWSARFAVQSSLMGDNTFMNAIERAILLGNDTDTTACVAGGWAGIIYGWKGIPQEWRDGLRGKDLVKPMADRLVALND